MKRLHSALLCVLLIIFLTSHSVCAATSVPEPVMKSTESVVRILAEYSDGYATGSGFVIKNDKDETLIATNYHVVEGVPYSISVWIGEEETVSATILAFTNQKDICILKLVYPVSLTPLTFTENVAKQGEAVYAVGFPSNADYLSDKEAHTSEDATITDGIISAVRETTVSSYGTPTKILQINAAINPGNSGGPLFNASGEVVGINTYGINDSQGIFGAIDVSELKSFMADNDIPIPKIASHFPWTIVAIISVVIMGIVTILIVITRKKKMKSPEKAEFKHISLCEYMAAHPEGIGINDAVAMLLPVALQLRDLHNNGASHMQVSPNSIAVGTNGAILANATSAETDRYTSGYAAPEIYKGSSAGNLSDIYSFCAVLYYVVSGIQPENSLSRTDSDEITHEDASFAEFIKIGLALDPVNRFATMQDVIIKLSPYNMRPFVNTVAAVEHNVPEVPSMRKAKAARKKLVPIIVAVLIIALLGSYFGCYFVAKINAKNGEFETADNLLIVAPLTRLHDAKLVTYIKAGQLLAARNFSAAKKTFKSVAGYLDADNLALEADYRHAAQYADANNFEDAEAIYEQLGKYKDAPDKLLETKYRKGMYVLYEDQDFKKAFEIFRYLAREGYSGAEEMQNETQYLWASTLIAEEHYIVAYEKLTNIKGYSDVKELLEALEEVIYTEGQNLYYSENFSDAKTRFDCVSSYRDSEKYITLIDAHTFNYGSSSSALVPALVDLLVDNLVDIFYFEDAAELLLSSQEIGEKFLCGKWLGDGYCFTMEEGGHIEYDLPWFDYGDFYKLEDGEILLYPEDDESDTRALFKFTLITPDSLEVFCYDNNRTYTLFKQ